MIGPIIVPTVVSVPVVSATVISTDNRLLQLSASACIRLLNRALGAIVTPEVSSANLENSLSRGRRPERGNLTHRIVRAWLGLPIVRAGESLVAGGEPVEGITDNVLGGTDVQAFAFASVDRCSASEGEQGQGRDDYGGRENHVGVRRMQREVSEDLLSSAGGGDEEEHSFGNRQRSKDLADR